ncbi:hypothetical protein CALCODRAFT_184625 [Calocera cornea HHB12733]|uniref:Uncharacterized protein n=1 Tax=Calocera cornea HHB12733 TaxID=1353952 RepID=A0A165CA76_9BASI|nr:hypothetical protein CALCODRAFT_184625 [Calocera cornea HHB12733]
MEEGLVVWCLLVFGVFMIVGCMSNLDVLALPLWAEGGKCGEFNGRAMDSKAPRAGGRQRAAKGAGAQGGMRRREGEGTPDSEGFIRSSLSPGTTAAPPRGACSPRSPHRRVCCLQPSPPTPENGQQSLAIALFGQAGDKGDNGGTLRAVSVRWSGSPGGVWSGMRCGGPGGKR